MTKHLIQFIVIFLISELTINGQSRWSKIYHEDTDAMGTTFTNTYDRGILIAGKHGSNYVNYNWLIKTDINGDILWEKTIGDPNTRIHISDIDYHSNGDIFLVGYTDIYADEWYDPLIMKLNSCGEKQWCKVFTVDGLNYSKFIKVLPNGSCVIVLKYMGEELDNDRICLAKFSNSGDLIWNNCYNSLDSSIHNEEPNCLTRTSDNGFLITGDCYYVDPNPPHSLWLKPYFIKIDSNGVFEWEKVIYKDVSEIGGIAWNTVLTPDSTFLYSSLSNYYHSPETEAATLLKMDLSGNIIGIYELAEPSYYGKIVDLGFTSDSTIAASAIWGGEWSGLPPKAVLIDTLGKILNYTEFIDNELMAHTNITFDNKLLFYTNKYEENVNQYDAYIFKLNCQLESDSFYTYPYNYDTLCPYSIISDTISQEGCDIIVGIEEEEEEMGRDGDGERMELYPNPVTDQLNCRLQIADCRSSLLIYDMFGRKQEEIQIPTGQKEIQIDVSDYPQGIYIAVLKEGSGIIGRRKFVVVR